MLSFIVLVFISVLPFVSTWITSPQDIFLEKEEGFSKPEKIFRKKTSWRLTNKGKIFLGIAALTIFFAWVQYRENEKATSKLENQLTERDRINRAELRNRDQESRRELFYRDSLNNAKLKIRDSISNAQLNKRDSLASERVEKGKNETIAILGRYSLRYDSSQKRIEKLVKDSSKITEANLPDFGFCNDTGFMVKPISNYEYILKFRFCNMIAPAKKINMRFYVLTRNVLDKYDFIGESPVLSDNLEAPINLVLTKDDGGKLTTPFKLSQVYVLMQGNYTDSRGKTYIPVNTLVFYDLAQNKYGFPSIQTVEVLRILLKEKGIIY